MKMINNNKFICAEKVNKLKDQSDTQREDLSNLMATGRSDILIYSAVQSKKMPTVYKTALF